MTNLLTYFKSPPPFEVWHSHPNQPSQILITAGMHGDELSSIEAAKTLINSYHGTIPLTIIPILNIAGHQHFTSLNPLDNKDPIYLYPGRYLGSSTSRLMHKLSQHTRSKKLWIDLHGGGKNEHLKPFIWAADNYPILSHLNGRVLIENTFARDLPYLILEAGELGKINQSSVKLHLSWINDILTNLDNPQKFTWHPAYNQIVYEKCTNQSLDADNLLWCSPTLYVSGKIS